MARGEKRIETKLIHAGEPKPRLEGAVALPIFQSSTFELGSADDAPGYHQLRYIRLNNTPGHVALHAKLAALEPMNENVLKLVGEGYKQSSKVNEAVATAEKVLALPIDLKVTEFAPTASGATLAATATGRAAQTAAGKPIPEKPLTLTFEFLNASGGVVASQDVQVPALKAGATQDVKAAGQGQGITGYRYKQK